ncbi:hypothetical protein HXX76_008002 [Chlamydomonas incerta]|uniref:Uncharacterized protein n=1 Tax=Chlamydomonas incerta TaxID=51695 RepID=A0A835VYS2_CHLIN|nr:hypothetical protein HXX76_008002 [Chlamydomonas incerta]|eukprot:KAG2434277.1 hypothetical protein HXX76_008002 [Chlamydomonas incerta]
MDVVLPRLGEPTLVVTGSLNIPLLVDASACVMPARVYEQVISPCVVYWCRMTVFLGLLAAGPNTEPSTVAQIYLQQSHAVVLLHVVLFATLLGVWDVDARVELAACLVEAACALTCLSWHGAKVPGGPPHPAALLAGRALVPLVNLSLAYAAGRWRPGKGTAGGRGEAGLLALGHVSTDSSGGAAAPAGCSSGGTGAKGCGEGVTDEGLGLGPALAAAETAAAAADRQGAGPCGCGGSNCRRAAEPQSVPVTAAVGECSSYPAAASQPPSAALRTQSSGAAAPLPQLPQEQQQQQLLPYRAFIRRRITHHYKIPWAEPEDIAPGLEERLAALLAALDQLLAGVHVRAGCIELTVTALDCSGLARDAAAAAGAHAAANSAHVALRIEDVIAALGLGLMPAGGARDHASGGASSSAGTAPDACAHPDLQVVSVQLESMGGSRAVAGQPAAEARSSDGARSIQALQARVVDLYPRVLLLSGHDTTPRTQPLSSSGSGGQGVAAARPPLPAALLRLRVVFGAGAGPAAADGVAVRGTAGFLNTRVTARQLRAAVDAGGEAGGEAGTEEWEYAIELMEAPPHPQLLTVQLAFPAAGAAPGGGGDTAAAAPSSPQVQWLSVPVLAVDNAAVAAELSAALQLQLQTAAAEAAAAECAQMLMCDLGLWLAAAAPVDGTAGGSAAVRRLPAEWVSELEAHLLEYTESAGLFATAARIRAAGAQPLAARVLGTGAGNSSAGNEGGQEAGKFGGSAKAAGAKQQKEEEATGLGLRRRAPPSLVAAEGSGKAAAECNNRDGTPVLPHASGSAVPSSRASGADGLQQYMDAWTVTSCTTGQLLECLMAVAFTARGLREGQPLWSAESAVVYAGLGVGAAVMLAGLWMPAPAWSRLTLAARIPRYCGALVSKALVAAGVLPAPVGSVTYSGGVGVLLLEGVVLSSGCLLPPRTTLLLCGVKLPLNAVGSWRAGAFPSLLSAALHALAVEALAMGTTIAFHAYVRRRYEVRVRRQQAAASA